MRNGIILIIILLGCFGCLAGQTTSDVRSNNLIIRINGRGEIDRVFVKDTLHEKFIGGRTQLVDCDMEGKVSIRKLSDGGIEYTKVFVSRKNKENKCTVTESYSPAPNSIRWRLIIKGTGSSWSTGIQTILNCKRPDKNKFWTTWGDPDQTRSYKNWQSRRDWSDPLRFMPFRDMTILYGGHWVDPGYSIPLVSVIDEKGNSGISLMMSPEDMLFDMRLEITAKGEIIQTRFNNRINKENTIVFSMDLVDHTADWRAPLGWMVNKYVDYFNPVNPDAGKISGCGAYSAYEGNIDIDIYKRMGGIVNWKASLDFPYMGMFVPPVATDTTRWRRFGANSPDEYLKGEKKYTTIAQMSRYASYTRNNGFYMLNYFNVTEFGGTSVFSDSMKYPGPVTNAIKDKDDWTDPNVFLYNNFPNSILLGSWEISWNDATGQQLLHPVPFKREKPYFTWGAALVTDCGDPDYRKFLLKQAKTHVEKFPDASGICIDRLDWLNEYNWKFDDKVSWIGNFPVRSLITSWKNFIPELSAIFHNANKVVYCNPLTHRLDMMRYIDGFYDEYGQEGYCLNLSAFLALNKTLMAWTPDTSFVNSDPDEYFQRHLYMGAFPTAPFPGNDHTILPDGKIEKFYLEYGFLLNMLRNKKWILEPDIIKADKSEALVNIFRTGDLIVVPVVFAREKEGIVRVTIKKAGELALWKSISVSYAQPGQQKLTVLQAKTGKDSFIVEVPVHNGCAMVELKEK
jgi:hypothetical protein